MPTRLHLQLMSAILLLVPFFVRAGESNQCIIRGACGPNPSGSTDPTNFQSNCLNCKLKEPEDPVGIDEDTTNLLYSACPHFRKQLGPWSNETIITDGGSKIHYDINPKVCCTKRQIEIMSNSFITAEGLLARCPVCYANWRKNFCASTCMPGNVEFLKISTYEEEVDGKNVTKETVLNAEQAPCGGFAKGEEGKYTDIDPGKIDGLCM